MMCMCVPVPYTGPSEASVAAAAAAPGTWEAKLLRKYGIAVPMASDDGLDPPPPCSLATKAAR